MNKSELIEAVSTTAGLDKRQAEAAIGAFVDSVVTKTKSGEQVSIFGFGTFKPTARAARTGRNPQTGAAVKIAASKGVKFQPATSFKTALNTRGTKKATTPAKKSAPAPAVAKKASATGKSAAATKAPATKTATKAPAAKAATKASATKAATSKVSASKVTASKVSASKVAPTSNSTKATAKAPAVKGSKSTAAPARKAPATKKR